MHVAVPVFRPLHRYFQLTLLSPNRVSCACLILIAALSIFSPCHNLSAQTESREHSYAGRSFPSLYLLPDNRWLGVDRGEVIDELRLYDSLLTEQSRKQWSDLNPLDVAALPSPYGDSLALLLARPSGTTLLFTVSTLERPDLTPVWQEQGSGYDRIITVLPSLGSAQYEAIVSGDSGVAAIRLDGTVRFSRKTTVLAAFLSTEVRTELILVERRGSRTLVSWIDLITGNTIADRPLDSGGDVHAVINSDNTAKTELIVVTSAPPTLFAIRKKTRGFLERRPLESFPAGLVSLGDGQGTALLYREFPRPRARIFSEGFASDKTLFYPAGQIFSQVYANSRFIMLIAEDTATIYDRNLEYLSTVSTLGGQQPQLIPFHDYKELWLLRTNRGTTVMIIQEESWIWLRQNVVLLTSIVLGFIVVITGIILYRRHRFIRAVFTNLVQTPATDGVVITTDRGRVLLINQSARRMLGMSDPVPLGRHISSYLSADDIRPVLDSMRRLLATAEPFDSELIRTIDDDKRTLRLQGRVMSGKYGGNSGYILLIEDITATLERDRLVNWASVAHHIAHEMKTPLGTVRASAEVLKELLLDHPQPQKTTPALQRILRQSVRLREIVDDLLTVARTEELRRVELDISILLSSLIDDFSEYVPSTIQLRFQRHGSNFRALIDPDQLAIAVRNLLDNARQAIGERESGEIALTLHDNGEHLEVVVQDNGIGMSRTTLDRLFQPYYTEKEGGSGIGTIIVKRVVEAHAGRVAVESESGVGTTFSLTIPRNKELEE